MDVFTIGNSVPLLYTVADLGVLQTITNPVATIQDPTGATVGTVPLAIVATGVARGSWAVPATAIAGVYLIVYSATYNAQNVSNVEQFQVDLGPTLVNPWALTTLDTVKSELNITDTSQDARLARMINGWSDRFNHECNRVLSYQQYTELISGQGKLFLNLAQYPLVSVTSVTLDGTVLTAGAGDTESDYIVASFPRAQLWRRWSWRWGAGAHPDLTSDPDPYSSDLNVQVVYAAGYVTAGQAAADNTLTRTLPYDLEEGLVRAVVFNVLNSPGTRLTSTATVRRQLFDPLRGGDHGILAELQPLWNNYRKLDRSDT